MTWRPRFTYRQTTRTSPGGWHAISLGIKIAWWPCTKGPALELYIGSYRFSFFIGTKEYW